MVCSRPAEYVAYGSPAALAQWLEDIARVPPDARDRLSQAAPPSPSSAAAASALLPEVVAVAPNGSEPLPSAGQRCACQGEKGIERQRPSETTVAKRGYSCSLKKMSGNCVLLTRQAIGQDVPLGTSFLENFRIALKERHMN